MKKIHLTKLIGLAQFLLSLNLFGQINWKQQNPKPSSLTYLDVHFANENLGVAPG